ncbi:MAG: endonuclease III [Myxococcales bacterium]|nr:endonuclease III [Myxococcales bacterium]
MRRAEKAQKIADQLEALYPETPIPLDHSDPFTLLIAVLLSAQTTDKKVNEVTPALFADGPTPEAMASLDVQTILEHIRQLGLAPTKAKNVKRLSEILCAQHDGRVPQSFEALEALPGVGHKTASVVMSQAFGVPAFPVDTHIHRLAARWGLSDGKSVEKTERDLKRTFDERLWNKLHLQIIFFGREYCPARRHDMLGCPICGWAASKKAVAEQDRKDKRRR